MAYLINSSRKAKISIAGVDYTDYLISWTANDNTYVESGFVTTTGSLVLGDKPSRDLLKDYRRNVFKRGDVVICQVQKTATNPPVYARHPRGYLYVLGASYQPNDNKLVLELSCEIGMATLVDSRSSTYFSLSPFPIFDDQRDMANLAANFVAAGQFLWQDNTGALRVDSAVSANRGTVPPGEFVSVLSLTAESVSPLALGEPLPETVLVTYQTPYTPPEGDEDEENEADEDEKDPMDGKVTKSVTTSEYETDYPTVIFDRKPPSGGGGAGGGSPQQPNLPNLDDIDNVFPDTFLPPPVSVCGNEIQLPTIDYEDLDSVIPPDKPVGGGGSYSGGGGGLATCNGAYETTTTSEILSAKRIETTTTKFEGPGSTQSYQETIVESPKFEQNRQYYADKFAYCRSLHATNCNPNGGCPYEGTDNITTSKTTRQNYFNTEGTVNKQVTNTYNTVMSAGKPKDWRSGNENGIPQDFQEDWVSSDYEKLYNSQRTIDEWEWELDKTTQTTTTYTSTVSARGVGLDVGIPAIDCMQGIVSVRTRVSTGQNLNPPEPADVATPVAADSTSVSGVTLGATASFSLFNTRINLAHEDGFTATVFVDGDGNPSVGTFRITSGGDGYAVGDTGRLMRQSNTDTGYIEYTVDEIGELTPAQQYEDQNIRIFVNANAMGPGGVDTYEQKRQFPVQLQTSASALTAVNAYGSYLRKIMLGEALGLQISEALREEVLTGWKPNLPFRYYDDLEGVMLAMQMDATSWGVSTDSSVMVTSALQMAKTDGIITVPSNIDNSAIPLGFPTKVDPSLNDGAVSPNPLGGVVGRLGIVDAGSGFTAPGTYNLSIAPSGTGTPLEATIKVKSDGTLSDVAVVTGGEGFVLGELFLVTGDEVGGRNPLGSNGIISVDYASAINVDGSGSSSQTIGYAGETSANDGNYVEQIDVVLSYGSGLDANGPNYSGVVPPPLQDTDWNFFSTLMCFVDGEVVLPGAALSVRTAGAIPLSQGTNIVTVAADIITPDLFAPDTPDDGVNDGNGGGGNLPDD